VKKMRAEKTWRVILATDIIEYAFVRNCLLDATFMGGEYLNE